MADRTWERLEHLPPGVVAQNFEGLRFKRCGGSSRFQVSDGTNWWPVIPNEIQGPFAEVE